MALDVYQLVIVGRVSGQYVENVLAFGSEEDNGVEPAADAALLLQAFETNLLDLYLSALPDNYECAGLKARRFNNGGGSTVVRIPANTTGSFGSNADASVIGPQVGFSINPAAGVYTTGKIFMPGTPTSGIVNGVFTALLRAAVQAFVDALLVAIVAGGKNFIYKVIHRSTGTAFSVDASQIAIKPGVQGRRLKPAF